MSFDSKARVPFHSILGIAGKMRLRGVVVVRSRREQKGRDA